jgi:SAM-dependent methyltransferase
MSHDISKRREQERSKYLHLTSSPSYGAKNHGQKAYDLVQQIKPNFVVDFGCGRNNFIKHLRTLNVEGVGIDFAFAEADILAPMHEVPVASSTADLITSFDALEHLLTEDVPLVLLEMKRIAAPNARFIFSICTRPSRIKVKGEGLHPTVQPREWWLKQISHVGTPSVSSHGYITGSFNHDDKGKHCA